MKKIYTSLVFLCLNFLTISLVSAQCACTNCPQDLPDNTNQDFYINVADSGGGNCDLATNPLMGVNLKFTHEYLGDLTMTLTSPGGQTITLVGAAGYHGETHYMCGLFNQFECADTFDIQFLDGANTPFESLDITPNVSPYYSGAFSPFSGDLGDFTGNACGTWKINVDDRQAFDIGVFIDFGLNFQNNTAIDCNSDVPLPIELVDFDGTHEGDHVALKWETRAETNNRHFLIERSSNGIDFEEIGNVEGSGTSFEIKSYGYIDARPLLGHAYYRLVQEDFDGIRRISALIHLRNNNENYMAKPLRLVPNPVVGPATLVLGSNDNEEALVLVTNLNGKVVWNKTLHLEPGGNFFEQDWSALPQGIYLVTLQSRYRKEGIRFVKL